MSDKDKRMAEIHHINEIKRRVPAPAVDESIEPSADSDDLLGVFAVVAICIFIAWMMS